ncbi:MAG: penicillin-binding protein 2 [Rhodospirillales bacterium]|nr:penicillin-binding protein 2 [Rhodospirillales bacterium]
MQWDTDQYKLFGRRTAMLAGGKLLLLSTLVGRMYYLQVLQADRYKTLAEENRMSMRLLPPPRGRILDRYGIPLAVNEQNYRVVIIPEQTKSVKETLLALGKVIGISSTESRRILREVKRKRSFVPVTVRENLTWEDVAQIEVNAPDLPGAMIDVGESRYYPDGYETAHILGYVAAVSEKDLTGDPLLELPGFRIGKSGIEKVHDLILRGTGGTSQVEVNAYGRVIRELNRQEGKPGAEIKLSIDIGLQKVAVERLGEESGAAVVIDIHTGDILAMASTPSYDPNAFNRGLSTKEWKSLIGNNRKPLNNKAISGQYAPGSTFKMIVALAALEKGVIGPEQKVFCSGHVELGTARFHCWKKRGHGAVDLVQAIQSSCDVYFYEIARRTGIERIASMARRFGFGSSLGLDISGERSGLIPDKGWKRAELGEGWHQGETLLAGIGQGYVLATPLQLAVMTARLANGGEAVRPHLTSSIQTDGTKVNKEIKAVKNIGVNSSHIELVRKAMNAVTNIPGGTAFRSRISDQRYAMAGKTGTAQVRRISKAEREVGVIKNKDLPWEQRDHASFVGFAPVDAPRYAVAVVVEHGGSGSKTAAPIARDILLEVQKRGAVSQPGQDQPMIDQPPIPERDA